METGRRAGEWLLGLGLKSLLKRGGRGLKRHHALADALALRSAYMAVKAAALAHGLEMRTSRHEHAC